MAEYKTGGAHRMSPIKITLFRAETQKLYDITNNIESISFSGDEQTYPRKLEVTMKNTISGRRSLNYVNGDIIYFYYSDIERFRGMIYSTQRDHRSNETFVCYDALFYLTKSKNTVLYKNINATDIIKKELKACGIPIGSIPKIDYKVTKKLFENVSREEIIREVLLLVQHKIGRRYKLVCSEGKANLIHRGTAATQHIYLDQLLSGTNSESIEEIATQALITKGSLENGGFVSFKSTNKKLAEKYGYIQHIISADDKATASQMKKELEQYLKDNGSPKVEISIESIGNIGCITGKKIEVFDNAINKKIMYYISADSHTISGGVHKMSLQLSKKLE